VRRAPVPHAPAALASGLLPQPHPRAPPCLPSRLDGARRLARAGARDHAVVHPRVVLRRDGSSRGAGGPGARPGDGRPVPADRRLLLPPLRGAACLLSLSAAGPAAAGAARQPGLRPPLPASPASPSPRPHALGELQHLGPPLGSAVRNPRDRGSL